MYLVRMDKGSGGGARSIIRLAARLGSPLTWSDADRCILAGVVILPIALWHEQSLVFFLTNPTAAPYVDRQFLQWLLPWQRLLWSGGWLAIIMVGLVVRRWAPDSRLFVAVTVQFFAAGAALLSYTIGHYTAGYLHAVSLAGGTVGLILFEPRQMYAAIGTFLTIVLATTLAEQLQLIPYAPLLAAAPLEGRHLSAAWLGSMGTIAMAAALFGIGLTALVVRLWRTRERQLAETSDQLARANDVISRYVAQQVTEQIRLGNYDVIDRQLRRRLTLFFSDIEGFTEVADRVEPEELSELLNEYFAEMTAIAERFGGTLDKFMGDAIMIFFGAPTATHDRDHALRAVRMAMAMQGRMEQLRRGWEQRGIKEPFRIRAGINTGVASVGTFGARGRMDYTAIGRQVNLAARLQVNCEPGRILLSHSTWVLVRDDIECVAKGDIHVKGVRDPVSVYEVPPPYPAAEPLAAAGTGTAA
jgi:class 3 adenylate cyclase